MAARHSGPIKALCWTAAGSARRPPPQQTEQPFKGTLPGPDPSDATEPVCTLGWKPCIRDISFVFGLCNCWLLGAASSCQAQHILHNKSRDFRGVGGPTQQRSAMKKGHQVLLASQLDRIFFFLLSIRLF